MHLSKALVILSVALALSIGLTLARPIGAAVSLEDLRPRLPTTVKQKLAKDVIKKAHVTANRKHKKVRDRNHQKAIERLHNMRNHMVWSIPGTSEWIGAVKDLMNEDRGRRRGAQKASSEAMRLLNF